MRCSNADVMLANAVEAADTVRGREDAGCAQVPHYRQGMFANQELTLAHGPDGPQPVAIFDLPDTDVHAIRDALDWRRRTQFSNVSLSSADEVLAMRALGRLCDMFADLALSGSHAVVRVTREEAQLLAETACSYVSERDVDSYQPPEERQRIAALNTITSPLFDLTCDLVSAQDTLSQQAAVAR
jgi:hypothetical protein